MKCDLYLIGDELIANQTFQRYIFRHLHKHGFDNYDIVSIEASETTTLISIQTDNCAIFLTTSHHHNDKIANFLASMTSDTVKIHQGITMPAKAKLFGANSYLLHRIQVHIVHSDQTLPPFENSFIATKRRTVMLFGHMPDVNIEPRHQAIHRCYQLIDGWTICDAYGQSTDGLNHWIAHIRTTYPNQIIETDNVARHIIRALKSANRTVTFAESCTGGLISAFLTAQSGSSEVFDGAMVTYANTIKSSWVGVDEETLHAHGAVSEEVVTEMSAGVMEAAKADYAIAVSGVAGPSGGTLQKPVGTVFLAVRSRSKLVVKQLKLSGDRRYVQEQSVLHAIKELILIDKEIFFKISINT